MRSRTKPVALATEHIGPDETEFTLHDIDFLLQPYWERILRFSRQSVFWAPGLTVGIKHLVTDLMQRGIVLEIEVGKNVLLLRKLPNKDWGSTEEFAISRLRRLIADAKKR